MSPARRSTRSPPPRIEELIDELRRNFAVVIVTHSMQQAARVSQKTAFFHLGELVEYGTPTDLSPIPQDPARKLHHRTDRVGGLT